MSVPIKFAKQGQKVGLNANRDLYVLDGKLYQIGKKYACCLGDYLDFCSAYRKARAKGQTNGAILFHI